MRNNCPVASFCSFAQPVQNILLMSGSNISSVRKIGILISVQLAGWRKDSLGGRGTIFFKGLQIHF